MYLLLRCSYVMNAYTSMVVNIDANCSVTIKILNFVVYIFLICSVSKKEDKKNNKYCLNKKEKKNEPKMSFE